MKRRGIDGRVRDRGWGLNEESKRGGVERREAEKGSESGSRAPPADKMIKRQISYIIFTLMLPYRNLWEGRDLCGRVYAPQGLI